MMYLWYLKKRKVKVKSLSRAQLFATQWTVAYFSAHGIFQARVLEWGAIAFSDMRHQMVISATEKNKAEWVGRGWAGGEGGRRFVVVSLSCV